MYSVSAEHGQVNHGRRNHDHFPCSFMPARYPTDLETFFQNRNCFHLIWISIQRKFPSQLETVSKRNGNHFHFGNRFPNQMEMIPSLEIVLSLLIDILQENYLFWCLLLLLNDRLTNTTQKLSSNRQWEVVH